ncbi:hypothetical protein WICPIJ_009823 [Wickerhamomyces pijperi]|uniref:Uncharacterized protein n=1 Tax=Wickerhamomyces pijperi TaxID=599730 RepID=A0A9P8PKY1_WICPI|nr:hypothetical protein WICPIJ_009823 [Wickerhamomyces pijperi]
MDQPPHTQANFIANISAATYNRANTSEASRNPSLKELLNDDEEEEPRSQLPVETETKFKKIPVSSILNNDESSLNDSQLPRYTYVTPTESQDRNHSPEHKKAPDEDLLFAQQQSIPMVDSSRYKFGSEFSTRPHTDAPSPSSIELRYNDAFKHLEDCEERFYFKDLTYANLDENSATAKSFNLYTIHGSLQRLERSVRVLIDPSITIHSVDHLHFLFFNAFIINKGILFKVGWSTEESKVYICTDCEKKLVTCKLIFDTTQGVKSESNLENIERRFEDGCFEHVCALKNIQARYQKVRLGKYKHERNKLLKKSHIDPEALKVMKELDLSYNRKVKENEDLFRFFEKNGLSLYDFKLNEVIGDDRRLNFFLHVISFVKVLFESYHKQLNLKKNETPMNIAKILTHLTIDIRLNLTTQSLTNYCNLVGSDPKIVYERLASKLCNRIERYLKVKTAPVNDDDRTTVLEIMGLLSNIDLNS